MKIETKYAIGEDIFFIHDNRICVSEIKRVLYGSDEYEDELIISYEVGEEIEIPENLSYRDVEELMADFENQQLLRV